MKTRTGFVSNSSSSSFIVMGSWTPNGVESTKLTPRQAKVAIHNLLNHGWDSLRRHEEELIKRFGSLEKIDLTKCDTWGHYHISKYLKLKQFEKYLENNELDDIYLTEFVSDGDEAYSILSHGEDSIGWEEGNHGTPYDPEEYISLNNMETDQYNCVCFPKELHQEAEAEEIVNGFVFTK